MLDLTGIRESASRLTQKLSGGQTQRVRFAIALVSNPELLVLDEPTVAMDVEGRHAFWLTMREFASRGKTVVFATHYLEEADAYADRAVLMAQRAGGGGRAHHRDQGDGGLPRDPRDAAGRRLGELEALPGVTRAERRGEAVVLSCSDSDAAIRALLASSPRRATSRSAAPASRRPSSSSPPRRPRELLSYTRYELLRTFRNRRFFVFSLGFPLVLYFLIAGPNKNVHDFGNSGISAPLYYMVGLASFGTMSAMLSSGAGSPASAPRAGTGSCGSLRCRRARISGPRCRPRTRMARHGRAALHLGHHTGRATAAAEWLRMTVLILIGLVPFAALGILIGHLVTVDSIGPVMGGTVSLLALVSGTWFPLGQHSFLHDVAQFLPSYWLVQAGHVALGGPLGARAWIVVAAWTVVLVALARRATGATPAARSAGPSASSSSPVASTLPRDTPRCTEAQTRAAVQEAVPVHAAREPDERIDRGEDEDESECVLPRRYAYEGASCG